MLIKDKTVSTLMDRHNAILIREFIYITLKRLDIVDDADADTFDDDMVTRVIDYYHME